MKKLNVTTVTGNPDIRVYKFKSRSYEEEDLQRFHSIIEFFKNHQYTIKLCSTENNNWYLTTMLEFNSNFEFYSYLENNKLDIYIPEKEYHRQDSAKVVISIERVF